MSTQRRARPHPAPHSRPRLRTRAARSRSGRTDRAFRMATAGFAAGLLVLAALIVKQLVEGAWPALSTFGPSLITGETWNVPREVFGILPFLAGTLLTSGMALLMAVPVSLGVAILLVEYAPSWVRTPLGFAVELLAAIPSVVYGLWGVVVLAPLMASTVNPAIEASPLGLLPIFDEPRLGRSMLTASVVLAIMMIPIVASISREVLLAVPASQREAALALGLTRWEAVRRVVLSYGRAGLFGAVILGLGRALGETMAVTMLIGNSLRLDLDFFGPGSTMAAGIASQFAEARAGSLHQSSLVALGLVLFLVALLVNAGARLLVRRLQHGGGAAA